LLSYGDMKFFTLRPDIGDRTRKSFYILSNAAMQYIGQTIIIHFVGAL